MNHKFYTSVLRFCFPLLFIMAAFLGIAQTNQKGIIAGKMLVKFRPESVAKIESNAKQLATGLRPEQFKTGLAGFDAVAIKYKAFKLKRLFPHAGAMEAKQRKHGLNLWYEIDIDATAAVANAVHDMKRSGDILTAQPEYQVKLIQPKLNSEKPVTQTGIPPATPYGDNIMNDPMFDKQWDLKNVQQQGGYAGADINVENAWKITAGKPNVIVAVVDLGVDYMHEDLAANMWMNEIEKNGYEGVDDDNNGYVDDIYGYNFADNTGSVLIGDHGTHVAGTIAAVSNNGIGISGIAGGTGNGDGVKIMSTQIFGNAFNNPAAAIVYGANNGAIISQNSWGYTIPGVYDQAVLDAIDYFTVEAGRDVNGIQVGPMNGGVVIFASGNDAVNDSCYPGFYKTAIAVSATSVFDNRSYYSNYGGWVDISAPGGEMYSADDPRGILSTLPGNQYGYFQGTSMACPHVSGVAALIVSQYGKKGFTNIDLKNRLFKTASPFIAMDAAYKDLMGIGRVNAGKAVEPDQAIPPSKITDLNGVSNTPNSIDLTWTAPADNDNGKAESYLLYYSTKKIDSTKLDSAQSISIDSAKNAGQPESFTITGLLSSTTYYVMIVSKDLWANESYLSNSITVKTQLGPIVGANPSSLEINLDVSKQPVKTANFSLLNNGPGAMTWNGSMIPVSSSWANPNGFNDTLKYVDGTWPYSWVGDDQAVPFSAATRFNVPPGKVFNLTHVANFVQTQGVTQPILVYIIKGGDDPSKGTLLLKQAYIPTDADNWGNLATIHLNGMYQFQPGEWFWVVFEYHEEFYYAQGATDYEQTPEYFLTSSNRGKTWLQISPAFKPVAFFVHALSNEGPLNGVTLSPVSGTINGNSNQKLTVTADGANLRNGTYYWKAQINSNDLNTPVFEVPVILNVTGQKAVLTSKQPITEFGNVFIGKSKDTAVRLYNLGLGVLNAFTFTSDNNHFGIVSLPDQINPGDSADMIIRFTPDATGLQTGNFIIGTNDDSLKISGSGAGLEPPVMTLSSLPVQIAAKADSTGTNKFTIYNTTGKYPLSYSFPDYAAQIKAKKLGMLTQGTEPFGQYVWIDSRETGGPIYSWNDISETGDDITMFLSQTKEGLYHYDLGFPMRVYNDTITGLYVTNQGLLTFNDIEVFNSSISTLPTGDAIKGCIAPLWFSITDGGITAREDMRVYIQREPGKFIVQYNEMAYYAPGWFGGIDDYGKATFQVVLYNDGKVEMNYKSVQSASWPSMSIIGIENKDETKGFSINPYDLNLQDNVSLWMVPVQPDFIKEVKPYTGVVPAGDSVAVSITADAKGLADGVYNRNLTLTTNDPVNERTDVPVRFTVTGISGLMQQTDSLDFGSVLNNSTTKQEAIFLNTGSKPVTILQVQSSNPVFTTDLGNNIVVPPLSELRVPVVFKPTATGSFSGTITLHSDNASQADFSITTTGIATDAPAFSYSITGGKSKTLDIGQTANGSITFTNNGAADMQVALEHPQWMLVNGDSAGVKNGLPQAKSYSVHKNIGDTAASFDWIELSNGLGKASMIRLDLLQTQQIQLPFEFPYYNKKYSSLYLWYRGSLLLSPDQDLPGFRTTAPSTAEPNGMIAALYDALYPNYDQWTGEYFGEVYYYADSNKLVVQYEQMVAWKPFVYGMVTFEIILHKDGRIKYQYKDGQTATWTTSSFTGIENEDGTDGESVYNQTLWYKDKSVIEFVPSKSYMVKAGQSLTVPMTWSTQSMTDGVYSDKLVINTNDPLNASVNVPLQLTVNGSVSYTTTDTVNYGKVISYQDEWGAWNKVKDTVSFTNTGTKAITINNITFSYPTYMSLEEYIEYPVVVSAGETKNYTLNFAPDATFSNVSEHIKFTTDLTVPEVFVPVTAFVTQPPVASVDSQVINITVQKTGSANRTVQLQNMTGKTGLDYNIDVMYRRPGITYLAAPVKQQSIANGPAAKIFDAPTPPNEIEPYGEPLFFTDSIEYTYDDPSGPIWGMGFGTDAAFHAIAHFKAGKNGFNLTHVSNRYMTDIMLEYKIKVVIKLGNDVETATPVYQQELTLAADTAGRDIMVKLDSALLMYPYEDFWIEWQFAEGMKFPQMFHFVENDKVLPNTFYYISPGYPFYRMIYAPQRFYIAAYEETDKTSGWLELSPVAGTVPAGASLPVDLTVKGAGLQTVDASAKLIMNNNDPFNATQSVMVNAHIDQPPYLTQHDTLMVNEGDTLNYKIPVADFENGTITVDLKDAPASAKIDTAGGENYFVYTPGYADSGWHTFAIQPKDNYGNQTTDSLIVKVINTNRVPVGKKLDSIITYVGHVIKLSLDTVFTEPDGETMLFGFGGDTSSVAKVLVESTGSVSIFAEDTGRVTLYFTATDTLGAKGIDTVLLIVRNNNPPDAHELPMQVIEIDKPATSLSLSGLFTDPEGDDLNYTVAIDSAQLATVTVDNGVLKLLGKQPGIAKVTVVASDGKGGVTQNVFLLKVLNNKGNIVSDYNITIGPVPFRSTTNIRFQLGTSKQMRIDVINMAGSIQAVLFDGTKQAGSHTINVNLANIPAGNYLVRFTMDGKQGVIQVAKL